jgi:hypothetical protein
MLESLISSKTRVKMLLKFFLNPENSAYLRGLSQEFGESSNAIRLELNRFENAGLLQSSQEGNKKFFKANSRHPLFSELRSIVMKHVGIDRIIENIVDRLGDVKRVYLSGDLAKGMATGVIDLVIIGDVDRGYLSQLVDKAEKMLDHKIRYLVYSNAEEKHYDVNPMESLLIWKAEDHEQ